MNDNCPKEIKILRILNKNRIEGLFSRKYYKSIYDITKLIDSNGNTKLILKKFINIGIIKEDNNGYYFDDKFTKKVFLESEYMKLAKEMNLGEYLI